MKKVRNFFKNRIYFWFYFSFIFLLMALFFSDSIGKKLKSLFFFESKSSLQTFIADIFDFKGDIYWRKGSDVSFRSLTSDKKFLNHWDRLRLNQNSSVTLNFISGYRVKILGESEVILESWDSNDSPIYLHLLYGDFELERKGGRGELFIVKEGKIFIPSQRPDEKSHHFKASFLDLKKIKKVEKLKHLKLKTNPLSLSGDELPLPYESSYGKRIKTDTLTHFAIEKKFKDLSHKFKKCQWKALKNQENPIGKTLLGLSINPSGKIRSLKVIESDIQSESLKSCIFTVLKNVSFKPFQKPSIYVVYSLKFEEKETATLSQALSFERQEK